MKHSVLFPNLCNAVCYIGYLFVVCFTVWWVLVCVCASLNTFWRIVNRAHFMLLEISSLLAIITTNLKSGLLVLQGKPLHSEPGGFRNNWNFLFIDTSTVSTRRG